MNMRAKNPLHLREAWVICFVLGLVMINFPFLHIFNKDVLVFGTPLIILYLMIGWPVSIAVIYLFTLLIGNETAENGDSSSIPPQDQA